MKIVKYLLVLLTVFTAAQSACKKDDANSDPEKERLKYFTQKPWKVVGHRLYWPIEAIWTDDFSSMQPCVIDDVYDFKYDGSATRDMGKSICDPASDQVWKGSWTWYIKDQAFRTNGINFKGPFNIISIDNDKMIAQISYAMGIEEYTFIHP